MKRLRKGRPQAQRDADVMVQYMQLKIRQRDWHGVADAANDLRVMEAETKRKK